jgi:phosphoglycolate phosphatase
MKEVPEAFPLPVRAVLFDLDGTLLDSAADLAEALNRLREERGLPPVPVAQLRPHVSHGARGMLAAGMQIAPGDSDYIALRDRFLDLYEEALCVHTAPFEGVHETLLDIARRGLLWGVVTNKSRRFTEPLLKALHWPLPITCAISGDSAAKPKPHPDSLLLAARTLGVEAQACVYVGDAERDVQAANAAGMSSLVAEYGYISEDEKHREWPATGWIRSPAEVLDWLPPAA